MVDSTHGTGSGKTEFIEKQFTYTWEIQMPSIWPAKFRSPKFSFEGHNWSLEFHTTSSDHSSYTALYIQLENDGNYSEVNASARCWVSGKTSSTALNTCFNSKSARGFSQFCERRLICNFNNFNIICELNVLNSIYNGIPEVDEMEIPKCNITQDFCKLLDNGLLSDVILAVNDKEIKAHKAILSGRSAVFAAMFEHEMQEKQLNRVKIDDMDFEVLKEMLRFIYTGEAPDLEQMSGVLLPVADKYDLDILKLMCEKELFLSLTVETAAETLILADLYSAEKLKKNIFHYFKLHAEDIKNTEGWKSLTESHSQLIIEMFCSIVK